MPTPRFMLSSTIDRDFTFSGATLKVKLTAVYLNDENQVRNPCFSEYSDDTLGHLDGFTIGAYYSQELGWFGFSAEYRDVYSVVLGRAEVMVKLLRKLAKKLAEAERAYGYAPDFPTYTARVAEAVGAKLDLSTFGLDAPHGGMWGSGDRYRWTGVQALRSRLDDLVKEVAPTA